jgi:hypothetical protein
MIGGNHSQREKTVKMEIFIGELFNVFLPKQKIHSTECIFPFGNFMKMNVA